MRIRRLVILSAVALVFASSADAATVVPVGAFRSIELRDGGHVVVRHGAVQRVSIVEGGLRYKRVRVEGSQRLVIESTGRHRPRGFELEIEIITPHISRVSFSNGGTVRLVGEFPDQDSIDAAVEQGGAIDIRAIAADDVNASVYSGGSILTTSAKSLEATVESGGLIKYWGGVKDVKKSVRDGGVVTRGRTLDAN